MKKYVEFEKYVEFISSNTMHLNILCPVSNSEGSQNMLRLKVSNQEL